MSQQRMKLWRWWKRHGDVDAKERHKVLNRKIKSMARRNKRKSFAQIVETVGEGDVSRSVGMMSKILKSKKRNRLQKSPSVQRISPASFTRFVATQYNPRRGEDIPRCRRFELDADWKDDLYTAVARAPTNKAVGEDELFAEALKICPDIATEWLHAIWWQCGAVGILPRM